MYVLLMSLHGKEHVEAKIEKQLAKCIFISYKFEQGKDTAQRFLFQLIDPMFCARDRHPM